jgi:hypothetical protein
MGVFEDELALSEAKLQASFLRCSQDSDICLDAPQQRPQTVDLKFEPAFAQCT